MTAELKQRALKDFGRSGLPDHAWEPFWLGHVAAIKRFAGGGYSNKK